MLRGLGACLTLLAAIVAGWLVVGVVAYIVFLAWKVYG